LKTVQIFVDGRAIESEEGTTVAAAMWNAGCARFRTSVTGQPRGPLCAMGICFECRVTIDGAAHRRACMETCVAGMKVQTGG
jgi:D-hydroxyproline dehydrogenase subunit gamma